MKETYCCEYHPDVFIPTKFHRCDLCVNEILAKYGIVVKSDVVQFLDDEDIISSDDLVEVDPLYQEPK